jgi:hypothetical protein
LLLVVHIMLSSMIPVCWFGASGVSDVLLAGCLSTPVGILLSLVQMHFMCWTNMITQVKRTQTENPDAFI